MPASKQRAAKKPKAPELVRIRVVGKLEHRDLLRALARRMAEDRRWAAQFVKRFGG
ncbi:MAG TPA: hypothetical protein VGM88_24690 [Kofleriaceae bacterium]